MEGNQSHQKCIQNVLQFVEDRKRHGVGVMLKEEYVNSVVEVKRVSDRIRSSSKG